MPITRKIYCLITTMVLLGLVGCGKTKIDGTSKTTFQNSVSDMKASLSSAEKTMLEEALNEIKLSLNDDPAPEEGYQLSESQFKELLRLLNGKTFKEILGLVPVLKEDKEKRLIAQQKLKDKFQALKTDYTQKSRLLLKKIATHQLPLSFFTENSINLDPIDREGNVEASNLKLAFGKYDLELSGLNELEDSLNEMKLKYPTVLKGSDYEPPSFKDSFHKEKRNSYYQSAQEAKKKAEYIAAEESFMAEITAIPCKIGLAEDDVDDKNQAMVIKKTLYGKITSRFYKLSRGEITYFVKTFSSDGKISIVKYSKRNKYEETTTLSPHEISGLLKLNSVQKWSKQQEDKWVSGDLFAVLTDDRSSLGIGSEAAYNYVDKLEKLAAFKKVEQEAQRGVAEAQTSVAIAYENGSGVEKDLNAALLWYYKASASRYQDAFAPLARLSGELKQGQLNFDKDPLTVDYGGLLQVKAQPGLIVFIDGKLFGATTSHQKGLLLSGILPGRRKIEVLRKDYRPFVDFVTIKSGEVTAIDAKVRVHAGVLFLESIPENCKISIPELSYSFVKNELSIQKFLPPGNFTIVASSGGESLSKKVSITGGSKSRLLFDFANQKTSLLHKEPKVFEDLNMTFLPVLPGKSEEGFGPNGSDKKEITFPETFYLSETEITQAQFYSVMGRNPSRDKEGEDDLSTNTVEGENLSQHPVENVYQGTAETFCEKLTAIGRARGILESNEECRLPFEFEWKYACRSGTRKGYYSRNTLEVETKKELDRISWYKENSGGRHHKVALKDRNSWGFFDMFGNVRELCYSTWAYSKEYGDLPRWCSAANLGKCPRLPELAIFGGSWNDEVSQIWGTNDYGRSWGNYVGFRVVIMSTPSISKSEEKTSYLKVIAQPGSQVFVNDELKGSIDDKKDSVILHSLGKGSANLKVVKEGFYPTTKHIHLIPKTVCTTEIKLKRKIGSLQISSFPVEAEIILQGEDQQSIKKTEALWTKDMPAGKYTVAAKALGKTLTETIVIEARHTKRLFFDFAKMTVSDPVKTRLRAVKLPEKYTALETDLKIENASSTVQNTSKVSIIPELQMVMVFIKPGSFMMGSPVSERGRDRDETQHKVTLTKGFWIGATEVTQVQYEFIMGKNPSHFKNDSNPVEQVSWYSAVEFCNRLSALERASGRLSADEEYRLPTEAEWEYCCRAGSDTTFGFGSDAANLKDYAWVSGYSNSKAHPIALKEPNAWGLYDMHGNVFEWCQDWYDGYPGGEQTDPSGPESATKREYRSGGEKVFRGGGWLSGPNFCRSAYRSGELPEYSHLHYVGFRITRATMNTPRKKE